MPYAERLLLSGDMLIAFSRPGSDLLSRVLRRSTIGAGAFHGRVRNGNGCGHPAITTRSAKGNDAKHHCFLFVCFGRPFPLGLPPRGGAKASIRKRMMPCMFEKLVEVKTPFVLCEHVFSVSFACRRFPAAGRAEPPVVWRAVRSEGPKGRQREDKRSASSAQLCCADEHKQ